MGGEKVFLSIVSERARALVVVRESWTRVHRWDASARRGADAGNDSDDAPPIPPAFFLSFVFCHAVLARKRRRRQKLLRFAAVYWLVTASWRIN